MDDEEAMALDDDSDEEVDDPDSGLETRYREALRDSRGDEGGSSGDDFSFARYMQQANLG
jgi:hypothetical protein